MIASSIPAQSLADAQISPNFNIIDYGQSIGIELGKNIGNRVAKLPHDAQVIGIRQPNGEITRFNRADLVNPNGPAGQLTPSTPAPEPNSRDLGALLKALIRNNRNNRNGGWRNGNNNNHNDHMNNGNGNWNNGGWNNNNGCC